MTFQNQVKFEKHLVCFSSESAVFLCDLQFSILLFETFIQIKMYRMIEKSRNQY
jgi:hypothetical protein